MSGLERRRRPLGIATTVLAVAVLALSAEACKSYRYRAVPLTNIDLARESLRGRDIRIQTDTGTLVLHLEAIDFPYVFGRLIEGSALVGVDLRRVSVVDIVELDRRNRTTSSQPVPVAEVRGNPGRIADRSVAVATAARAATLRNARLVDDSWIEGFPVRSDGASVRVDLRNVRGVAVREIDGPKTVLKTTGLVLGIAAATAVAVGLIVALTKESCPFVYVDRGEGWELVGEAYAGAAFRSTQRGDLLPLPPVGAASTLAIRLRNEARETQYTDQASLVIVEHPSRVRALSTFDGQIVLVGAAEPPMAARDRSGADVRARVAAVDTVLAETDVAAVAAVEDPPLADELAAEFEVPAGGRPVLELVGGNTALLDLVFGRFFAAMGDRLDKYLAQGNEPAAGPRIQGWREREGVDLIVEVRRAGADWRRVAAVPTVGPAALREIAVPLPVDGARAGDTIQVRLRSGLGFWRIDRLALSARDDSTSPAIHRLTPTAAVDSAGGDQRELLGAVDGRYNTLREMNETVDMEFALPPASRGATRSAFLYSNGYYNVHPPIQSAWSPGTLKAIRDEPGALSRLARDLARVYREMAAPVPDPGHARSR